MVPVLTSNATRELSEALKRRCLFLHLDFPDADLERRILASRVPELPEPSISTSALSTSSINSTVGSSRRIAVSNGRDRRNSSENTSCLVASQL